VTTPAALPGSEPGDAPSLARRAAIAIVLMVGFYALAAGMAFALAWIPYAAWAYGHRFNFRLAFFCLGGAYLILRAIVPRRDRFEAPGPRLQPERQPRLFEEIRGIAGASGQEMPAEVYLVPDVNAWVAQRGGVMGVGGRRIMGLGLPLLQAVSVSEMRAIVAHEFGHYFGGDVKLGPVIYRTREALVRTVIALHQHSGFLQKPFEWYAALFFRVTHAVSRHQELQADALAARIAGADALARGLRTVHGAGLAFGTYWAQEVAPVLGAGYLPPLAVGFSRFLEQPRVNDLLRQAVETEEREERPIRTTRIRPCASAWPRWRGDRAPRRRGGRATTAGPSPSSTPCPRSRRSWWPCAPPPATRRADSSRCSGKTSAEPYTFPSGRSSCARTAAFSRASPRPHSRRWIGKGSGGRSSRDSRWVREGRSRRRPCPPRASRWVRRSASPCPSADSSSRLRREPR